MIKSSDFFKACCDGHNWAESTAKTVRMPEQDYNTFTAYLQWLYTNELVVHDKHDLERGNELSVVERMRISKLSYITLLELAVLADTLIDVAFSNIIVDEMIRTWQYLNELPGHESIRRVYKGLPDSSTIRKMFVDVWCASSSEATMRIWLPTFPKAFTVDLVLAFKLATSERSKKLKFSWEDRCKYHTHDDKTPKTTDCDKK